MHCLCGRWGTNIKWYKKLLWQSTEFWITFIDQNKYIYSIFNYIFSILLFFSVFTHVGLHSLEAQRQHTWQNSQWTLGKVPSYARFQIEKVALLTAGQGANLYKDAFQQNSLTASNFILVLKAAGRPVSPVSVQNDCWMIYQVASGSSVGHCTWAECQNESSEFVEDCGCSHLGCLERRLMVWQWKMRGCI